MKIWGNNFFSQHILPGRYARYVNKKYLKGQYKIIQSAEVIELLSEQQDAILDQLKKDFDSQADRKKGLEDKVKAILLGITVSITAMTFSLNYEKFDLSRGVDLVVMAIFLVSVFYFISSAILTVETLVPVGFNTIQTEVSLDMEKSQINVKTEEKGAFINRLLKEKLANDLTNLQISNSTYAALKLLRNGIIIFVLYFLAAIFSNNLSSQKEKFHSKTGKVILRVNDSMRYILPYTTNRNSGKVTFPSTFSVSKAPAKNETPR